MATPVLTAGGRAAPPKRAAPEPRDLLDAWHAALTRMLELAVRYGELDALVIKRQAWLEANPWHERHDERHALMWQATRERNLIGGRMMDEADALDRIQYQLPERMIDGLAALIGHPLWPGVPGRWAMTAARIQSTDIFRIARTVLADLRAEQEEAMTA